MTSRSGNCSKVPSAREADKNSWRREPGALHSALTLSYRKPELLRIKQRNAERIAPLIDDVFILAGGIPPFGLLREAGVTYGGDQQDVRRIAHDRTG